MDKKGLRSTDQRKLIVETFFRADNHVSIEELLAQVRIKDRRVGYATVYRTLKLLAECGVANERRFGDGLTRYELADDVDAPRPPHLRRLWRHRRSSRSRPSRISRRASPSRYGFELRSHKHELYGVCPRCQAKRHNGH